MNHRHPAMSNSNPFRRKENQILGLDNSSFISTSDSVASAVARFPSPDTGARSSSKRVRIASPHAARIASDSDGESSRSASSRGGTAHDRSEYRPDSLLEGENPFAEGSSEDSYEDDDGSPRPRRPRRMVPYKAGAMLNVDSDNPWRTSTLIGNLPGTGKPHDKDMGTVPSKAQRTLGLLRPSTITEEDIRRDPSLSPQTENVAPKALRTLGIPSNPFQRPPPQSDRSTVGDDSDHHRTPRSGSAASHRPMDVDEFKRFLLSGQRPGAADNGSSTDVSSLSRSSPSLSQADHRSETPRTSYEILPDDFIQNPRSNQTWAHLSLTYSPPPRSSAGITSMIDTTTDPAAVLTEPFSPLKSLQTSPTDLNKPLPTPPSHKPVNFAHELPANAPRSRFVPKPPMARRQSHKSSVKESDAQHSIAELPDNEVPESRAEPQTSNSKLAPVPPPPRRGGSNRASMIDSPTVPELSGTSVAAPQGDPPQQEVEPQPQHTHPQKPQTAPPITTTKPPVPPARNSSISRRLSRSIAQSLPPTATRSPGSRHASSLPTISTNLACSNTQPASSSSSSSAPPPPPPRHRSSTNSSATSTRKGGIASARNEPLDSDTKAQASHPLTSTPATGDPPNTTSDIQQPPEAASSPHRTSSPARSSTPIATASPTSPLKRHGSTLGAIVKAVAASVGNEGKANPKIERKESIKEESGEPAENANNDVRKGSIGDQPPQIEKRDVLADLGELQREVDALRGKFETSDIVDPGSSAASNQDTETKKEGEDTSEHG